MKQVLTLILQTRKLGCRDIKSLTHLTKEGTEKKHEVEALATSEIPRNKYIEEREPQDARNTQRRPGTNSATTNITPTQRGNPRGPLDQNSAPRCARATQPHPPPVFPIQFHRPHIWTSPRPLPLPPPIPESPGIYLLSAFHCRLRPRSTILQRW